MSTDVDRSSRPTFPAYSPFAQDQINDPFEVFSGARREAPVFYSPVFSMWVVTKFQDVRFVYENPETFSNSSVIAPRTAMPAAIEAEFEGWTLPMHKQVVMSDPPQHTRLKRLMMKAFTSARVAQFEPWIHQVVNGLIGDFVQAGSADLVQVFTSFVPTDVIGKVLGVPTHDSRKFRKWVGDINLLAGTFDVSEEERVAAWRGIREFEAYAKKLVEERRGAPREDAVSYLIEAKSDDGSPALTNEEVVQNVLNLAGAGADTSGNLIAQTVYLLLQRPERWEAVRNDRALLPNALEESLRYASVVRGLVRRTTRPVAIGGIPIPEGDFVYIALASANRDEEMFPNPDVYDMNRVGVRNHLGFGVGAHTCLGISLARLEGRIAIGALLDRLPSLSLADANTRLELKKNIMAPGIKALHVRW